MASIDPRCTELKLKYDTCFNNWYTEKFLKGDISSECNDLFRLYKGCIIEVVAEKKIDKLIDDARKESPFIQEK